MVASYMPDAGDIVWLDFDPQTGREQGRRRPALVLTDSSYNRASGLFVVCTLTSKRKPYTFALQVIVESVAGAVLVDHHQCMEWMVHAVKYSIHTDTGTL